MVEVVRYQPDYKDLWDSFVDKSKNGTFLFKRDYMEYHSDRFTDDSLLFFENGKPIALLPASLHGTTVVSHGGLTYGGIISSRSMTAETMLRVFAVLSDYFKNKGILSLSYKRIPSFYCSYPSEEDLYALFRHGAQISKCGISSTIYLPEKIPFSNGKKGHLSKAKNSGLVFQESSDFDGFMDLMKKVLLSRHNTLPVHTSEELKYLHMKFPQNIKLYTVSRDGRLLSGAIVYETSLVAHTQYLANSDEGRTCGALELVLDHLISDVYSSKRFFDFGISTEDGGRFLNEGLIKQKQEFGARATTYQEYCIVL